MLCKSKDDACIIIINNTNIREEKSYQTNDTITFLKYTVYILND